MRFKGTKTIILQVSIVSPFAGAETVHCVHTVTFSHYKIQIQMASSEYNCTGQPDLSSQAELTQASS